MNQTRILLIDDSRDAAIPLAMFLERLGHHTMIINQPELLRSAIDAFQPAIILLDLAMPGMGGLEAASLLRSEGYTGLLIAVTGFADDEHREQAAGAGFDHYLVKPVYLPALKSAVDTALVYD